MSRLHALPASWLAVIACEGAGTSLARAQSLSGPVTGWSSGVPAYISMFEYVPAKLADAPAVVVAAHWCGGSASAFFSAVSGIVAAADKHGFVMVFPQTTNPASAAKCWDVGSKASLIHDGGGDTQAIAQMVKHEIDKRHADAGRVYIMGTSSGAMLTQAMLAVYPDVFKAGAAYSGVPAGCWSAGWTAASNWSSTCADGRESKTPMQWGELVRAMYPAYAGPRPRVQLWHGTADDTIAFNNQAEAIKQWTDVLDLSTAPMDSASASGFKIEKWHNRCGFTVLEARTQENGGHSIPIDSDAVIDFFGLTKPGAEPEAAACGNAGQPSAGAPAAGSGAAIAGRAGSAAAAGRAGSVGTAAGSGGAGSPAPPSNAGAAGQMRPSSSSGSGSGSAMPAVPSTPAASGSVPMAGRSSGTPGAAGSSMPSRADNDAVSSITSATAAAGTAASPMSDAGSGGCEVARTRDASSGTWALLMATFAALRTRRTRKRHP